MATSALGRGGYVFDVQGHTHLPGPAWKLLKFQERYGYPALTDEVKAKILGVNGTRIYGVDPVTTECA